MKIPQLTCMAALPAGWASVLARDLNTAQKQARELARSRAGRPYRDGAAGYPRSIAAAGNTTALSWLAMLAAQAGELDKARRYALQTLQNPSDAYDSVHSGAWLPYTRATCP